MSPERITSFTFNMKAHVIQYTGDKQAATGFITNHLVSPNFVSEDGSDLKVKYEGEAGDRIVTLRPGMYAVVLFDRVYGLDQGQFARFMVTCS